MTKSYNEIIVYYNKLHRKYANGNLEESKYVRLCAKLDEWNAEYKRKTTK